MAATTRQNKGPGDGGRAHHHLATGLILPPREEAARMSIEALAELLKSRGCGSVCYFHTDHFGPWSGRIDDASARAVERMAEMARANRYARRLSLFYNVFVPYRLDTDGSIGPADSHVPGDRVV